MKGTACDSTTAQPRRVMVTQVRKGQRKQDEQTDCAALIMQVCEADDASSERRRWIGTCMMCHPAIQ